MRLACSGFSSWIEKKVTIVTPSRLLADVAYQQFTLQQLKRGHDSWERPSIMSMGAWLTSAWQDARYRWTDVPTLLSPSQEHLLWKQIIQRDGGDLFDVDATARAASHAAKTLADWEIPAEGEHWNDGSDALQFARWLKLFGRECRRNGWITRAALWQQLPQWISRGAGSASGKIAFPVVQSVFPAFRRILAELGDRALTSYPGCATPARSIPVQSFDDFSYELDFAARCARLHFEHDSSKSIGILIPDLAAHRASVERAFQQVFYPAACRALIDERFQGVSLESRPFRLDTSIPLAAEPVVSSALLLLQLAKDRIPISEASAILRSPWLPGEADERSLRAIADIELRRKRELDVARRDMEYVSRRCPQLAQIWRNLAPVVERNKSLDTFAGWSRFIGWLLQAAGWPGDQELSNAEQNTIEAWKNSLSQLGALSLVSDAVSFETAVRELRILLRTGSERGSLLAPIQILDPSQAIGLEFDVALLLGMSEEFWPPASFASPLVPLKLQRERGVSASSPQILRAERQRMTASIFAVAPDLIATFSGRPSPLIGEFVSDSTKIETWVGKTPWQSFKPALLEESDDSVAPHYQSSATTRGGTSIIKAQSLCPFRAFSEFRLQAGSLEEGCLGLDSRERGGNLHQALELVWQRLQTRDQLRATPQNELEQLVESAAKQAVTRPPSSSFAKIVATVEIERLKAVILDWLAIERERQHNFKVETIEQEKYFDLAGLRVRLRLDRIDRLCGGELLLIDYKSGELTVSKLDGERPEEPQLFVYAASLEEDVAGLFFGQLKAREARLKGISKTRQIAGPGNQVSKDWYAFLLQGKRKVYQLAEQFRNGYAAVDPLKGACDYCAQKPFCRIYEARTTEEAEG